MSRFGKLKNLLKKEEIAGEKKLIKKEESQADRKQILEQSVQEDYDREAITKIVDRMRDKYIEEGVLREGDRKESDLQKMISGNKGLQIRGGSPKELALYDNPMVKMFGKFYLMLQSPISKLTNFFYKSLGKKLEKDLLASGMNYTADQYLTLSLSATIFIWLISQIGRASCRERV